MTNDNEKDSKKVNLKDINKQSSNWFMTINAHQNTQMHLPTITTEQIIDAFRNIDSRADFVFQLERGNNKSDQNPDGYMHYQATIFLPRSHAMRRQTLFNELQKNGLMDVHLEIVRKDKAAQRYCSKSKTRFAGPWWSSESFENGIKDRHSVSQQGERSDRTLIKMALDAGRKPSEIMLDDELSLLMSIGNQHYMYSYFEALMKNKFGRHDRDNIRVIYITGDSNAGKSYWVRHHYSYDELYIADARDKNSFDKYQYQPVVLLDEFRSQIEYSTFFELIDRYVTQVPCRYHNKYAGFTTLYIVSKWELRRQYQSVLVSYSDRMQLYRRIHEVWRMNNDHTITKLGSGMDALNREFGKIKPSEPDDSDGLDNQNDIDNKSISPSGIMFPDADLDDSHGFYVLNH